MESSSCIICYEDATPADNNNNVMLLALDPCGHEICRACLQTWAEQCERQGKVQVKCPCCQQPQSPMLIQKVLQRPYEPNERVSRYNTRMEYEAYFQEWIQANQAQQCGHCGAWVLHNGGCDAMMCICGFRWCWECRIPFENCRSCACTHLVFYDNVMRREASVLEGGGGGGCSSRDAGGSPFRLATTDELQHGLRDFLQAQATRPRRCDSFTSFDSRDSDTSNGLRSLSMPRRTSRFNEDDGGGGVLWDYLLELENPTGRIDSVNEASESNTPSQALLASRDPQVVESRERVKWKRPRILTIRFWTGRLRRRRRSV